MANHARRQLKRRYKVRHGVLQIHDERQVKGVSTAFNAFFTERTDSGDFRHMKVADIGRLVGSEWRGLTNEEKDKYYKLQKLDRSRYELEVKTVYGRGIEGPPALNAAT
ncbi:MAG: hypothetical protein M1812_005327 [Candelaria pacifica]|nr:MAG: hypothetical protein M1812_005327 [Candelaria pacifica]